MISHMQQNVLSVGIKENARVNIADYSALCLQCHSFTYSFTYSFIVLLIVPQNLE
jgi:hypothetical protein